MTEELRDRVHSVFRRCKLSLHHPWFTAEKLHYGTTTILVRRDGDLYAAIPDNQVGGDLAMSQMLPECLSLDKN